MADLRGVSLSDANRTHAQREHVEQLLRFAEYLPPQDRHLLRQVYEHGVPVSHLAQATGIPARSLNNRLKKVLKRVGSPIFRFVAGSSDLIPSQARKTATYVALHGLSLRDVAEKRNISLHRVREHMNMVRVLAKVFVSPR